MDQVETVPGCPGSEASSSITASFASCSLPFRLWFQPRFHPLLVPPPQNTPSVHNFFFKCIEVIKCDTALDKIQWSFNWYEPSVRSALALNLTEALTMSDKLEGAADQWVPYTKHLPTCALQLALWLFSWLLKWKGGGQDSGSPSLSPAEEEKGEETKQNLTLCHHHCHLLSLLAA